MVISDESVTLLVVADGMGGHADGALAAEATVATVEREFAAQKKPILDPRGFLHRLIERSHAEVVGLGKGRSLESRPRATCALCLVQDDTAFWGHVGDSRIYHLRGDAVVGRSRDHSHVEVLLYAGAITVEQLASHPMRNYVECCLGGAAELPRMSISGGKTMAAGDVMLVCSDGFWAPLPEAQLASLAVADGALPDNLAALAGIATRLAAPHSDNTSAAAVLACVVD